MSIVHILQLAAERFRSGDELARTDKFALLQDQLEVSQLLKYEPRFVGRGRFAFP